MRVYKVYLEEGTEPFLESSISNIMDIVKIEIEENLEVGSRLIIEPYEISEEAFKNLPEWQGP